METCKRCRAYYQLVFVHMSLKAIVDVCNAMLDEGVDASVVERMRNRMVWGTPEGARIETDGSFAKRPEGAMRWL